MIQQCSIGTNVRLLSAFREVSGVWLFKGTRVPVKALFENLEDGAGVDDFLQWFPGVTREQVLAFLEFAEQSLTVA
jgi:uncharacterized protein (DUF433 family)